VRAVNQLPKNNAGRGRIKGWMPSVVWAGIIFTFAVAPCDNMPLANVSHIDSIVHFAEYVILAILVLRSFLHRSKVLSVKIVLFTLILAGGYGILIELIQSFVPSRSASGMDVFFNFAGIIFGITVGKVVLWRR